MDNRFYTESLYPLQDKILSIINSMGLGFYLTGGTALSRNYLFHRFSDDIDLFVNSDPAFKEKTQEIEKRLKDMQYSLEVTTRGESFVRMLVQAADCVLKVDLVNDLVQHFGEIEHSEIMGRVDNIPNMLSNKLSALPRLEIKDFVDIAFIAMKYQFNWRSAIDEAAQKDAWVNPIDISKYFATTDPKLFSLINWIKPIDFGELMCQFELISDNVLLGYDNIPFTTKLN